MRSDGRSGEFDELAADYEEALDDPARRVFAPSPEFFIRVKWDHLLRALERETPAGALRQWRWLDVGCGDGKMLRLGRDRLGAAVGADISLPMLKRSVSLAAEDAPRSSLSGAKQACLLKRADHPQLVNARAESLPFPSQSFDLVTAVCLLHHLPTSALDSCVAEMVRLLRPCGVLAIAEHNPLNPVTRGVVHRSRVDRTSRLLRAGQAVDLCKQCGLGPVRVRYCLFLPARLYRVAGRLEFALHRLPLGGQYWVIARKPG